MRPLRLACGWLPLAASLLQAGPVHYEVLFKGAAVATQTVTVAEADGVVSVRSAFAADLPVFVARHHFEEDLSVRFQPDGTVLQIDARRADGPLAVEIRAVTTDDGSLQVVRSDRQETSTNLIRRQDYDFNSLVLYGTAPEKFLPTNSPARVLDVAEGRVVPITLLTISENDTYERQRLASQHLVWTAGDFISHSWHPERFGDLPRRYIRHTENGEFVFNLLPK